MATNGILKFQGTNKATFVGATSNVVIDTVKSSLGIGVDVNGPTSNLHVVGNVYVSTELTVGGTVTATTFAGDGSGLTGISTSSTLQSVTDTGNVTSNTIQFTNATTGLVATGNVHALKFIGDGSELTGISTSPTLQSVTDTGNVTSNTIQFTNATTGFIVNSNSIVTGNVTAATFLGDGSGLTSIPAAQITGTLDAARIPDLDTAKITTGTLDAARIPTLNQNTTGSAGSAGSAATATTATNQSGGTVSASTGYFSGALNVNGVIKSNVPSWNMWDAGSINSGTLNFTIHNVPAQNCTVTLSTGRVTATVAGRYFASFHGFTESSVVAGTGCQYFIRKNGASVIRNYHVQPVSNYSALGGITVIMDLAVNDYMDVSTNFAVHHSNGVGFCGFMIG